MLSINQKLIVKCPISNKNTNDPCHELVRQSRYLLNQNDPIMQLYHNHIHTKIKIQNELHQLHEFYYDKDYLDILLLMK